MHVTFTVSLTHVVSGTVIGFHPLRISHWSDLVFLSCTVHHFVEEGIFLSAGWIAQWFRYMAAELEVGSLRPHCISCEYS